MKSAAAEMAAALFFDVKKLKFPLDKDRKLCYNKPVIKKLGVAQLVACYLGVVEAAGSSPVTQTRNITQFRDFYETAFF